MGSRVLGKKRVLESHVFDVQRVEVVLPDGRERNYDLVDHADAVTILPLDADNQVYFVRQFRVGAEKELLELPAGVMDEGEEPIIAARRELREETGMNSQKLDFLGGFYMAAGYSNEYMNCYLARGLFKSPLSQDEDEFLSLVKIPLKEAYQMARRGEIEDSKTLAALLFAELLIDLE